MNQENYGNFLEITLIYLKTEENIKFEKANINKLKKIKKQFMSLFKKNV